MPAKTPNLSGFQLQKEKLKKETRSNYLNNNRLIKKKFTDEVAVMLDTRDALEASDAAMSVENPDYVFSWKEK